MRDGPGGANTLGASHRAMNTRAMLKHARTTYWQGDLAHVSSW